MSGALHYELGSPIFFIKLFYDEETAHGLVAAVSLDQGCLEEWEGKGVPFWRLDGLLLQMGSMCNGKISLEQATLLGRSAAEAESDSFKIGNHCKRYLSVSVSILYQYNGSMQGVLKIERHKILFRSGFELIRLIQESIDMKKKKTVKHFSR